MRPFPENQVFGRVPPGHRLAFDPARGRLWSVCENCSRWSLVPLEERADAIWHLERIVRDVADAVAHTDTISLHSHDELRIVRVGRATRAEQSLWRYGRTLRRRQRDFERLGSRVAAVAYGAVAYVGEATGVVDLDITWDRSAFADIQRWRHFGWAAWHGRVRCPQCHSVLRALRYDMSWWLYPRFDAAGKLIVGVPCSRCDPWSPRDVFDIEGPQAVTLLRRVLAYQHIMGASERQVRDAADEIAAAGSADAFVRTAASGRASLWRLGPQRSLALEIALGESAEDMQLQTDLRVLEQQWRDEEALARIIDEELTSGTELRRHFRRLRALERL
ncbi:MAG: hypothetical protein ACREKM_11200 [Longimicrobiales bacterium]